MDPKLEEFCRAHEFKPSFLRNMQQYCREVIQPLLDEREQMIETIAALTEEVRTLKQQKPPSRTRVEREQVGVS